MRKTCEKKITVGIEVKGRRKLEVYESYIEVNDSTGYVAGAINKTVPDRISNLVSLKSVMRCISLTLPKLDIEEKCCGESHASHKETKGCPSNRSKCHAVLRCLP